MTRRTTRTLVMTLIAVMTLMIMCSGVSHAAKKTYRLPCKIKAQDSTHKITYKGKTVKHTIKGDGTEKFVLKSSSKYRFKKTSFYEGSSSYTMKKKSGRIILMKGKNANGDRVTIKYTYRKGKLVKRVENTVYSDDEDYRKGKRISTVKTDKYGNLKKVISKNIMTKHNGKVDKSTDKVVFRNKYKGKYLYKTYMKYYSKEGKRWEQTFGDSRTISYKSKKLSKKQYKRYKPIVDYLLRNSLVL